MCLIGVGGQGTVHSLFLSLLVVLVVVLVLGVIVWARLRVITVLTPARGRGGRGAGPLATLSSWWRVSTAIKVVAHRDQRQTGGRSTRH